MTIPDYIIYDEIRRREEAEKRDGGLQPLHLPLYRPELEDAPERVADEDEAPSRGVIIIDMNSWDEVTDD